jgi:hypothetical protein
MLVACRPAGLSGLGAHYAGVDAGGHLIDPIGLIGVFGLPRG